MEKIQQIQKDPVYNQILKDSFGGIIFVEGTQSKYNASNILKLWNETPEAVKESSGGIMKGVFNFLNS